MKHVVTFAVAIMALQSFEKPLPKPHIDPHDSKIFQPEAFDYTPRFFIHATGYCSCPVCCGKWAKYQRTASGTIPEAGVTIAADKNIFPFKTCLDIPKIGERIVEDTGSAIRMFRIDVFFSDHQTAVVFGFQRDLLVRFCDEEIL